MRSCMLVARSGLAALVVTLAVPVAANAATATFAGGTLTITGDASAEAFGISDVGTSVRVTASSSGMSDPDGGGGDCIALVASIVECLDIPLAAVVVNGGGGGDTITFGRSDGASDSFIGNGDAGNDVLTTAGSNSSGSTTLNGGADDDNLTGDATTEPHLNGGDGNDTITNSGAGIANGDAGNDSMTKSGSGASNGGVGDDTLVETAVGDGASTTGGDGADTITKAGDAGLNGDAGADLITISSSASGSVNAGADNDTINNNSAFSASINGGAGDDTINGVSGSVNGGDGNDVLNAGTGSFSSDSGGAGNDLLNGSANGSDFFSVEPGADTYNGGTQPRPPQLPVGDEFFQDGDAISYSGDAPVAVTLDNIANDGASGEGDNVMADVENIYGGNGNDLLDATGVATEPHVLSGNRGDDTLIGAAKDDYLYGGNGSDTVNGAAGDDFFDGDESTDPTGPANDQAGNDTYNGGDGNDSFDAGSSIDTTNPAIPTQFGAGLGADTYTGGAGEDSIFVSRTGFSSRTPDAADPSTTLTTYVPVAVTLDGVANDGYPGSQLTIAADIEDASTGSGADTIIGNGASNVLSGGGGNDTINGLGGVDLLFGGNGADAMTSRDLGFDKVDCGIGVDAPVQGDVGDELSGCEGVAVLTPLTPPPDTTRPTTTLSGAKTIKAATFLRKRTISVTATPSEPALLQGDLFTGAVVPKIGQVLLGRAKLGLGGKRTLKVKVSKSRARTIVRRARSKAFRKKGYALTMTVVTTDAVGLSNKTTRTIRIKR